MGGYRLGVDLGTTWTAAAVARDGATTIASLSQRSPSIPSVVHVAADGSVLVGDAAVRRGIDEPERIAREMKRRIGDPTPMVLGGAPWAPELLQARLLRWVVDQVAAEQGGAPDSICVTHPANWGAFKLDLLTQAIRQVGVATVDLLPEPVAAATWYASQHRLDDGATIAVYDLGGGTFDTAVVRRRGPDFDLLGRPDGIERFGGIDVDAAVFEHVVRQLGSAWDDLDRSDPEALADAGELRQACVGAKEALSVDTSASVPVRLPSVRTTVRITRDELEAMVRAPLAETVVALRRTIESAGLTPADLTAVLLVGGSSRIPLVSHLVSGELGVPVALDANPKFAVPLGAALHEPSGALAAVPPTPAAPDAPPAPPSAEPPAVAEAAAALPAPGSAGRRRRWVPVAAVVAAIALLGGAIALLGGDDNGGGDGDDPTEQAAGDGDDTTTTTEVDDGSGGAPTGDGVLRIGLLLPSESGDLSFIVPPMRAAAQLAVQDLNDEGGVLGEPVVLVEATAADAGDDLQRAFDDLLEAGVDFVVGPVDDESVQATRDLVVGVGLAGCAAYDTYGPALNGDEGLFVRTIPSDVLIAHAFATVLQDDGVASVGIVAPGDSIGLADSVAEQLEGVGLSVGPRPEYERGSPDAESIVTELSSSDVDAVLLLGDSALTDVVVQGERAGFLGPFYGDHNLEDSTFGPTLATPVAAGSVVELVTIDLAPGDGGDGAIATQAGELLAAEGADAFPFGVPYLYDCIALAGVAAEAAGDDAASAIAAQLVDTSRDGEACFTAACLPLAADGVDIDFDGESSAVDLDDDGEVTGGHFVRAAFTADGSLEYRAGFDVFR